MKKTPPRDFLVGIVDREPMFGGIEKLIVVVVIALLAIAIVWWVRRK